MITFYAPLGEGGISWLKYYKDDQACNIQLWTDAINSLLVTSIHSLGKQNPTCHEKPHGGSLRGRVNQKGLWDVGFAVTRGRGDLCFLQVGVTALFEQFVGWQGSKTHETEDLAEWGRPSLWGN